MSYEDILAFRRPQLVSLAPDGKTIAYSVRDAQVDQNRNRDTVYLIPAAGGTPKQGPVYDKVGQLIWDEHGALYVLATQSSRSEIWRVDGEGRSRVVVSAPSSINIFAVTPGSDAFYYTTTRTTPPDEVRRRREEGFVYDWERHTLRTITNREYSEKEWEDIWVTSEGQPARLVHSLRYDGALNLPIVRTLAASPSGSQLALEVT